MNTVRSRTTGAAPQSRGIVCNRKVGYPALTRYQAPPDNMRQRRHTRGLSSADALRHPHSAVGSPAVQIPPQTVDEEEAGEDGVCSCMHQDAGYRIAPPVPMTPSIFLLCATSFPACLTNAAILCIYLNAGSVDNGAEGHVSLLAG